MERSKRRIWGKDRRRSWGGGAVGGGAECGAQRSGGGQEVGGRSQSSGWGVQEVELRWGGTGGGFGGRAGC